MTRIGLAALTAMIIPPGAVSAQWPAGRGNYWAKVSTFYHQTTESFRSNGDKRTLINAEAENTSKAVFFDALIGVTGRLDFWVQVPYFDLTSNDVSNDRNEKNLGDIRLSARYNLLQLRGGALPISVRFTTKIPVSDFPIDAEIIPVGEGQFDYEVWLEGGLSLWPLPAYSVVWLGYRFRAENEKTQTDPGDEVTFLAEFGGMSVVGRLGGKIAIDGTFSRRFTVQRIELGDISKREILYLGPALNYSLTESTVLEAGIKIPLIGQNFPAGNQFSVSLFHFGSLFP